MEPTIREAQTAPYAIRLRGGDVPPALLREAIYPEGLLAEGWLPWDNDVDREVVARTLCWCGGEMSYAAVQEPASALQAVRSTSELRGGYRVRRRAFAVCRRCDVSVEF